MQFGEHLQDYVNAKAVDFFRRKRLSQTNRKIQFKGRNQQQTFLYQKLRHIMYLILLKINKNVRFTRGTCGSCRSSFTLLTSRSYETTVSVRSRKSWWSGISWDSCEASGSSKSYTNIPLSYKKRY